MSDLLFGIFDHLDRGSGPLDQYYADRLACVKAYDAAGLYGYHLAEHHGTPLGMAPSPGIFLATVAQATQRLRFGPMVYLLPFYHPVRLAEEIAMLDQLSGGRYEPGIGRGASPIEAMLYGNNFTEAQSVFDEVLAIVKMALADGQVEFEGKHFHFKDVPMEVGPLQKPYPPFWYGINSVDSAERCVERDFNGLVLVGTELANEMAHRYLAAANAAGKGYLKLGLLRFVVVDENPEAALRVARRAYPHWQESLHHLYHKYGRSPVHGERPDFDGMIARGQAIAGTPATVAAAIVDQVAQSGANYFVAQPVFGDMSRAESLRSIGLYTKQVIPAVRAALPAGQPAWRS